MNRLWVLLVIIAVFPALLLAQPAPQYSGSSGTSQPYQPAVPPPSIINGNGGWAGGYGGTGASTAAGSAMNGMASVISAKGNYNLSTSAAAMNMSQVQKQEIQNHQQYTNTYFEMRATNKAARKAEEGPQPTMEEIARIAHDGAPKPLASDQRNPMTGQLAGLAAAGQFHLAARRIGTAIGQASHLRQARLYRSDESPPNHRNHV
jgi:hypothetical protein